MERRRSEESESLLDAIAEGRVAAVVSHFAVHAVEAMLPSPQKVSTFLTDIEVSKGLTVYDTTIADEQPASILSGKTGLDFDSVQFYVAKRTSSSSIVSFDKHFDGCGIPRREPSQILKELEEELTEDSQHRDAAAAKPPHRHCPLG